MRRMCCLHRVAHTGYWVEDPPGPKEGKRFQSTRKEGLLTVRLPSWLGCGSQCSTKMLFGSSS